MQATESVKMYGVKEQKKTDNQSQRDFSTQRCTVASGKSGWHGRVGQQCTSGAAYDGGIPVDSMADLALLECSWPSYSTQRRPPKVDTCNHIFPSVICQQFTSSHLHLPHSHLQHLCSISYGAITQETHVLMPQPSDADCQSTPNQI